MEAPRLAGVGAAMRRALPLLAIWLILTDGAAASLWFGVPAVAIAVAWSLALSPPARGWRWRRVVPLAAFFVEHSLRGGIDVARRAVDPRGMLAPEFVDFTLRLPPGVPCVLFADITNLLPGTLSAEVDGRRLRLHVLDVHLPRDDMLRDLEERIAALLGIELGAWAEEGS